MREKIKIWFRRYFPAEVVGTVCAVIFPAVISFVSGNIIIIALAGTWGENAGFYGTMLVREVMETKNFAKSIRNIFLEFGVAETLDSLLVRPASMYFMLSLFDNLAIGIVAGKILADVIFYIPTIISFELRKKYL